MPLQDTGPEGLEQTLLLLTTQHATEVPLWGTLIPGADTMPKFASAVNVPAYAQSSHSGWGMARASLDNEDAWEDDFQTPHMLVCYVVWQEGGSHRELAAERMEASGGSPSWQSFFQVDIDEEEPEMLKCIDPHWRATRWLQVAVQGITKEEVPWYKLVRCPADVRGRRHGFDTGQVSSHGLVVEHQGAWGGQLPTCSDHPQYWSVYD